MQERTRRRLQPESPRLFALVLSLLVTGFLALFFGVWALLVGPVLLLWAFVVGPWLRRSPGGEILMQRSERDFARMRRDQIARRRARDGGSRGE